MLFNEYHKFIDLVLNLSSLLQFQYHIRKYEDLLWDV